MRRLATALAGAAVAGLGAGGCARTVVGSPLNTGYSPGNVVAELGFMEEISQRTVVANDEGLHALFALADAGDRNRSYEERVDNAKARGWLSEDWDEPGDLAMQRGTLARCVVVMCKIKGGVLLRTLGPTARYATRELVYLDILPQGTEEQTLSGPELVGALNKAQDFLRLRAAREREESGGGGGGGAGRPG